MPTFNEVGNVCELIRRIDDAIDEHPRLDVQSTEVLFIDDSTDGTEAAVRRAAGSSAVSVRCVHREEPIGGLGGAVADGLRGATFDLCVTMDADLQHPPELIGTLVDRWLQGEADVVVASRYAGGGTADGLAGRLRRGVSHASTMLVKALFPMRLHACSDPMTGFFLVDRRRIDLASLRPQGFKILLEMLANERLRIAEVPFEFGARFAGDSKATFRQGTVFLRQLIRLRFGKLSGFMLVGAAGAVVNIFLVWLLTHWGFGVVPATVIAAEVTIVGNFLAWDRYVFGDIRHEARGFFARFWRSFVFNNVEAALRITLVVFIVERAWMGPALATAVLLVIAFLIRYLFHALVVYAPRL